MDLWQTFFIFWHGMVLFLWLVYRLSCSGSWFLDVNLSVDTSVSCCDSSVSVSALSDLPLTLVLTLLIIMLLQMCSGKTSVW